MSGPKVVRVITREELVAAGEALLSRLDAALGEWERCVAAIGASDSDRKVTRERRDALERMLRADKFDDFARAAADEISFLELDGEKRLERAAHARAQEKARIESGRELARALLRQIGLSSPDTAELERAAAGELSLKELDSVLSRARQALFVSTDPKVSGAQRELAVRLSADEKAGDFEAWRARSVAASPQVSAMLAHVANLELLGANSEAAKLQQEVHAVCALEDEAVRSMRLDSLQVALKRAKEDAVAVARLRRQATLLSAEAQQVLGAQEIAEALSAASSGSKDALQAAIEAAQSRLDELRSARAAESRRRAVLSGLQQLGYEVQEQLSTATTANGRLIVRERSESNYGVEISAGAGMERIQVRTVALSAERDTTGDVAAEQRWCGDFGELQKRLAAQGAKLVVEKALGVGAVPVKVLADARGEERSRTAVLKPAVRRQ